MYLLAEAEIYYRLLCRASSLRGAQLFATSRTVAHQAPLSMEDRLLLSILQARILEWIAIPSSRGLNIDRF